MSQSGHLRWVGTPETTDKATSGTPHYYAVSCQPQLPLGAIPRSAQPAAAIVQTLCLLEETKVVGDQANAVSQLEASPTSKSAKRVETCMLITFVKKKH